MALINHERILNENPAKKLKIAYDKLKTESSKDAIDAYSALYSSASLSFLLENSRYIFGEPHAGYNFYLEHVVNNSKALIFTNYSSEYGKVYDYLSTYRNRMSDGQQLMYESLLLTLEEKMSKSRNITWLLEHTFEQDDSAKDVYWSIVESVYSESADAASQTTNLSNHNLFFILAPFVAKECGELSFPTYIQEAVWGEPTIFNNDDTVNMDAWKSFIEQVVILSKLQIDEVYCEALNSLPYSIREYFIECGKESIKDQVDSLTVIHAFESTENYQTFNTQAFDCFYSAPEFAVNRVFADMESSEFYEDENNRSKSERAEMRSIVTDILTEYVSAEYLCTTDDNAVITGYNYFPENTTLEAAYQTMIQEAKNDGRLRGVLAQHSTTMREEESGKKKESESDSDDEDDYDKREQELRSKIHSAKKPEQSLTGKIQTKAMDIEAKQMKLHSKIQHSAENLSNAAKAITNIPKNVIDSVKKVTDDWEKADVEKRRAYMIEPGYRKKSFKALKLALMYGATAYASLALVPVLAIIRHFSNDKDRRIRNELSTDIDTEIKICDEKINDAASAGDQKEKYRLMRIKASLERESLRVKTNSKYI